MNSLDKKDRLKRQSKVKKLTEHTKKQKPDTRECDNLAENTGKQGLEGLGNNWTQV